MDKKISISYISTLAWQDFVKEKYAWIGLSAGGLLLGIAGFAIGFYMPDYSDVISIALTLLGAVYTAILHQNGLDAAYGRSLTRLGISSSILFASLFFIALSFYNVIPAYTPFLLLILPENFSFLLIANWIVHGIVSYFLMRCMFVGMILLEEKSSVKHAFMESFAMTRHHIFLLFGIFIYLSIALALSALTVIGYFMVLPYTMIFKALLFKQLRENIQS